MSQTKPRSFGKYYDDQRDRMEKAMQNKNTQLNNVWREDYDKRQREKKERKYRKELEDCSEKMIEISEECKTFYKNKFESEKNDENTEKNSERS